MRSDLFKITSKVLQLARCGRIACARKLFDEMPLRDLVAFNAMISGYSRLGLHAEVISLFRSMRICDLKPDHFSLTSTLSSCAFAYDLHLGMELHGFIIVMGYQSFLAVNNSLIDMYGKCMVPSSAGMVFEEMQSRNEVSWCSFLYAYMKSYQLDLACEFFNSMPYKVKISWNIMISGHAQLGDIASCLDLLADMRKSSCQPDQWTLSALMNACAESLEFFYGCMIHLFIIKSGWSSASEVKNSILSFYSELGCLDDAKKVFESIECPNNVSWNAMISVHMKSGDIESALFAFQNVSEKNLVSWTSIIMGFSRNGSGEKAMNFFVEMIRNEFQPDEFTFRAVLHACSILAVLKHGKMVHGRILRDALHANVYVANGLVNMYAKCGELEGSNLAFNDILYKDLVSWNTMLFGFGLHGLASQALQLFGKMVCIGVKPDKVTFVGLLMTCNHSGLIEESRMFFESMKSVYQIPYETYHLACMVYILGRGGFLAEAKEIMETYSDTNSLETFLGACSINGELGMAISMMEEMKASEPKQKLNYVLLSNLYSATRQWKEAEMVRKALADEGMKKMPGCSWIEVKNKVTAFVAGDQSQPYIADLHKLLYFLEFEMKNACFIDFES